MSVARLLIESIGSAWPRNLLLVCSVAIAYLLFGTLIAFDRAYRAGGQIGEVRMITTNKLSFTQPMPMAHFEAVNQLQPVGAASFAAWFGGYYQEPRNRLHTIAVDAPTYLAVYGEDLALSPMARNSFLNERDSLLVGEALSARLGWQVGDRVPILNPQIERLDGTQGWSFRVAGIVRGTTAFVDTNFVYIHYDRLNAARAQDRDTIGWIVSQPAPGYASAQMADSIDRLFEISATRTTTDSERSFALTFINQFGDLALVTTLILGCAFVSLMVIVTSTTTLAIRRRIREIGILKALGFSRFRVMSLFVGETLVVVVAAGMFGLMSAAMLIDVSAQTMAAIAPGIEVTTSILLSGFVSLLVLALVSSAPMTWRLVKMSTADALGGH